MTSNGAQRAGSAANPTPASALPTSVSVMFVCLGNICRSPMAEGVFRHITRNLPDSGSPPATPITSTSARRDGETPTKMHFHTIDSSGTGAYHALQPPDARTLNVLSARGGITSYSHLARAVRVPEDFLEFDYLLAMDADNLEDLREMRELSLRKVLKVAPQRPRRGGGGGLRKDHAGRSMQDVSEGEVKEAEGRLGRVLLFGAFGRKDPKSWPKFESAANGGANHEEEDDNGEEVIDPYYGGKKGFDIAYEQVERFSQGFLRWLETRSEYEGKNQQLDGSTGE
ncbi:MAG: hypothetical protein M1831_004948 [Alyxoria varia]|nr:MAG: hypothetical protein M1831_004948 [Alyxoria varia]